MRRSRRSGAAAEPTRGVILGYLSLSALARIRAVSNNPAHLEWDWAPTSSEGVRSPLADDNIFTVGACRLVGPRLRNRFAGM
jgi:hypothetical protein